jgi:biotin carboxylase
MITQMGDKITAKDTMIRAGVPVIPGSEGLLESLEEAKGLAKDMGYPVILKATAGGGGSAKPARRCSCSVCCSFPACGSRRPCWKHHYH